LADKRPRTQTVSVIRPDGGLPSGPAAR